MKTTNRLKGSCKKIASWLFIIAFLANLVPPFEIALFPRASADTWAPSASEALVTTDQQLMTALANPLITTIYLGADINLRDWGLTSQDYLNTSTTSNSYRNDATTLMNIAQRAGGQLTINGTDPSTTTKQRHKYTDRRTNDQGSIPLRLPSTAMTVTFKDIDIYGYNYYGLLYNDSTKHTIILDGVYGVMSQFLHNDAATVIVRDSILKVRDTGLRSTGEFFECGNVRVEGKTVFDHQSTDNDTMFWVKNESNRNLTVADNAIVTLIERGYNSYGVLYPSGNNLTIGENAKMTSILAEPEVSTGTAGEDNSVASYTTGYNYGTAVRPANQSFFTFSGSEAQTSVTVGAGSELNIIHPYSSTSTSNDILRTTTSAGVTVNEGGILNIYSAAQNSRVLDTANLVLNNPRLVTLYTTSTNNYLFSGTVAAKASKLKSVRYYSTYQGSNYTFQTSVPAPADISALPGYTLSDGNYNTNRSSPTTWFFQTPDSFDVTSANINGTGTISRSTYAGSALEPNAAASITSTNFNASAMRVVQIDGDYSRRPTIDQAEAGETTISGTGITDAQVNLYDPSGKLLTTTPAPVVGGKWEVTGLDPLVARTVYSATQQANIAGHFSSPSAQVTMTVNAKTFRLIATNNTEKSYLTGYLNAGFNNIANAATFNITNVDVIIFNDPDKDITGLDFESIHSSLFNAKPTETYGTAYSVDVGTIQKSVGIDDFRTVGREIPYNCKVWARAKITTEAPQPTVLYDAVSWRNIFTPYTIWTRAVLAGSNPIDRIYIYQVVEPTRTYGFPYMGDGKEVYVTPDPKNEYYDSVMLTADSLGLANKDALLDHWSGTVGPAYDKNASNKSASYPPAPYPLVLDNSFKDGLTSDPPLCDDNDLSKYTLNYVKRSTRWEDVTVKFVTAAGQPISAVDGVSDGTGKINIPLKIGPDGPIAHTSANDGTNSAVTFHSLGGRYSPPSDNTYSPIGWYVDTDAQNYSSGGYKPQADFADDKFDPVFNGDQSQVLYVVYSQSMFKVVEEYYHEDDESTTLIDESTTPIDTSKVQYFADDDGGNFTVKPKRIGSSLPISWTISGSGDADETYTFNYATVAATNTNATPVSNQYDIFPDKIIALDDLEPLSGGGTVTIKYYYTTDSRNNGIPNGEEEPVTVRWRGYTVDGTAWTIQSLQTIYGRRGFSVTIPNNYAGLTDINKSGVIGHTIDNTVVPNVTADAEWIFDEIDANVQKPVKFGGAGIVGAADASLVYFDYAFATNGSAFAANGSKKDKDQYVTENYCSLPSNDDFNVGTPIIGHPQTKTYILRDNTYSKMPPTIPGYVYIGYRWDSTDGSDNVKVYQNGLAPVPVSKDTSSDWTHEVTFLYRPAANGSVTVVWIGETYAKGKISFNTVHKTGYAGEEIKIYPNEMAVSSGWNFVGSYNTSIDPAEEETDQDEPLVFQLDDSNQTGEFRYKEAYDEVIITAKYISDDNSLDFTQVFPKTLATSTDPVTVIPFTLNGYELTGWVILDNYGNEVASSKGLSGASLLNPVDIDPGNGSQTITFSYRSTVTSLYIRCYDETGKEIGTAQKISNVNVGDTYCARAPIVESGKYALQVDEPLTKSIVVTSGTNLISFNYQDVTSNNAYMILRENAADGTVFGYQVIKNTSQPVSAPDLKSAGYTHLDDGSDDNPKTYNGSALTFIYTRDMLNVTIQPVDSAGANIGASKTVSARAGEMYEAVNDITVTGYTLTDPVMKKVYTDPSTYNNSDKPLIVKFTYKKDTLGVVNVIFYYGSDPSKNHLGEYSLEAVVGSKLTVRAEYFEGFSKPLVDEVEVPVTASNPPIYFQYTDDRNPVTADYYRYKADNDTWEPFSTAPVNAIEPILVVGGKTCSFNAPYIDDYVFVGYVIGTAFDADGIIPVSIGETRIDLGPISSPTKVYLCYDDSGTVILDQFVTVTVRGIVKGTSSVLYEYTVNRLKDSGPFTANAQKVFGYELSDPSKQTLSVNVGRTTPAPMIFEYTSSSINVTIKAQDSAGNPVKGFSDIIVPAVKDQPFSYNAPYIPGWNLTGAITGKIPSVGTGSNELIFTYTEASGNVTIILKENDENGRIIKTISQTVIASELTKTITIPDLTGEYYTEVDPQAKVQITSVDTGQTVEFYYTKDMRPVNIQLSGVSLPATTIKPAGSYRVGEVASFTAPAPPDNYKIYGDERKLVDINPDDGSGAQIVTFSYTSIASAELVINAVDAANGGNLLYTYTLTGTSGQSTSVPAPYVPGYVLDSGQPVSQTGTYGTALKFVYVRNTSTVTVKLFLTNGGDITYLAPAGFLTSFETEKGNPCTIIAPNLDGYVLAAGQAAQETLTASQTQQGDQEVSFYYRLVSDLYATHTIVGMDNGTSTELYKYSFLVRKDSGSTTYTATSMHGYTCTTNSTNPLPNNKDGVIIFRYALAMATIAVNAFDKDDPGIPITGFPIFYYDAEINRDYTVRAPYIDGYALVETESLYKTVSPVSSDNALNGLSFQYVKYSASDVILELHETNGNIVKMIQVDSRTYSLSEIQGLLTSEHYSYDTSNAAQPTGITYPIQKGVTPPGTYTFYYTKDTRDITVVAVDDSTGEEIVATTYTAKGRIGEMYKAVAQSVRGYSLVGLPTQMIFVDTGTGNIRVVFRYAKNTAGNVTVTAYYMDDGGRRKNILFEYVVSGNVDTKMEIYAPAKVDGWKLDSGQSNPLEHTFTSVAITYEFMYVMKTAEIDIVLEDDSHLSLPAPPGYSLTQTVQAEIPVTIMPPAIPGYMLKTAGPYINQIYTEGQIYTLVFQYQKISTDDTIICIYKDTNGNQLGAHYSTGLIGAPVNVVTGITPPFDATNYTLTEITLNGGLPVTSGFNTVTAIYGTHREVVLTYSYSGVIIPPSNGGTVITDPQNPTKGQVVTGTITPDDGYELATLTITDKNGNPVPYSPVPPTLNSDGTYTFTYTQPEGGVTIDPTFRAKGSGGSSVVIDPTDNGSVTVNPRKPAEGQIVTLTLTPNLGYKLKSVTVTDKNGGNVSVTLNPGAIGAEGVYTATYIQPPGGATVDAVFVPIDNFSSSVSVDPTEDGSVTVNPQDPAAGTSVTVILTPNTGYDFSTLVIEDSSGNPVPYSPVPPLYNGDGTYTVTYTQPPGGATIHAEFVPSVLIQDTQNGTITVDDYSPMPGSVVTITPNPKSGYRTGTVTVTDKYGNPVALTENPDGTLSYTQPNGGVTITGTFTSTGSADITVNSTGEGDVNVNPASPKPGEEVSVIITPNDGYAVGDITIKDDNGKDIPYTLNYIGNGQYEVVYIQPDGSVSIDVKFRKSISINQPQHGGITVDTTNPDPGKTVTITVTPENGYKADSIAITDKNGNISYVTLIPNGDGTLSGTYVQPEGGVTIDGTFLKDITVTLRAVGDGVVRINPVQPQVDNTVYVITIPGYGNALAGLNITTVDGTEIIPNDLGDGLYSYTQPNDSIDIVAVFEESYILIEVENGHVRMEPANPKPGQTVTLTFEPSYGYMYSGVPTFKDGMGNPVNISPVQSGLRAISAFGLIWPEDSSGLENGGETGNPLSITPMLSRAESNSTFVFYWSGGFPVLEIGLEFNADPSFSGSNVVVEQTGNGLVAIAPLTPVAGDQVTVSVMPGPGYVVGSVTAEDSSNTAIMMQNNGDGTYTYTQPDNTARIKVVFVKAAPNIRINAPTNGTVNLLVGNYTAPGEEVAISVAPIQGYTVDSITILDALNQIVEEVILTPVIVTARDGTTIRTGAYTGTYIQPDPYSIINAVFRKNVEIIVGTNGIARLDNTDPSPGEKVKLTIMPNYGYTLGLLKVMGEVVFTLTNSGSVYTYEFTQPLKGGSTIEVAFVPASSSGTSTVADDAYKKAAKDAIIKRYEQLLKLNENSYTQTQKDALQKAMDDALAAIDKAATKNDTDQAKNNGIDAMNAVPTGTGGSSGSGGNNGNSVTSNIADDAYKNAAKDEITKLYDQLLSLNGSKYTQQQKDALKKAQDDALDAISKAKTKDEADKAKTGGIEAMNAVPAGTGGNSIGSSDHGRVTVDNSNAKPGEIVTVYTLPEDGYELDTLHIKDSNGNDVPYTKNSDGTYSFVQPAGNVTITAEFKPVVTPDAANKDASDVSGLLNTVDHTAYVSGRGNGVFAPEAHMTRAEAAQMFYNLLSNKNVPVTKHFPDVQGEAWYATAVNVLASLGIVKGLPNGHFEPNKLITRAEFVTIAVKFADISPGDVRFNDVPPSHWAYSYINTAANFGWVSGVGNGNFAPNREITRAEAVTMINKVLKRYPDRTSIDTYSGLKNFSDVVAGYWAYYDIMEAANTHDYEKNDTGETWE